MHMLYTLKFGVLLFLWDFMYLYLCVCVCPLWFSKFSTLIRCYFYSQGKKLKGFFFFSLFERYGKYKKENSNHILTTRN